MKTDLGRILRRLRPDKRRGQIARRALAELPRAEDAAAGGPPLLLDTTVYIDMLEGTAPSRLDALLTSRTILHSALAVAELSHALGRLDPAHPGTRGVHAVLRETIERIPAHRLSAPDPGILLEAGVLAGVVARLTGRGATGTRTPLIDAAIYLQGMALGAVVLTRNHGDFDAINQLVPAGRVLFYDRRTTLSP